MTAVAMTSKTQLSLFALAMLMTGAVDGIRNLPSIAIFGPQLIFFFLLACVLFLIPTGLISGELCAQNDQASGIYVWSKKAFGPHWGALAIWLQWINTMVWFPTTLSTIVGTAAYLVNPHLTHSPVFLVTTSLLVFWGMTWWNHQGLKESGFIASIGTVVGVVIPIAFIIICTGYWVLDHKPLAISIQPNHIIPHAFQPSAWVSLTSVITAFVGMELASVHVKKVKQAKRLFPQALLISIVMIILTMGLGALAVALVVPHQNMMLVTGTIQVIDHLTQGFHMPWLVKALGIMLLIGSLGAMVNWLISPAAGLAQAAQDGFLPKRWAHENTHGVPSCILILQGLVVSISTVAFFLMPSINGSYWLLSDLSTEVYLLMYVLMFSAALVLIGRAQKVQVIPGKKTGAMGLALVGLAGCILTLIIGFIPPNVIAVGSNSHFIAIFSVGLILMVLPAFGMMLYRHCKRSC